MLGLATINIKLPESEACVYHTYILELVRIMITPRSCHIVGDSLLRVEHAS
jgi:hypothetical protein